MNRQFSGNRYLAVSGLGAACCVAFGFYAMEPLAKRFGIQVSLVILLVLFGSGALLCIDLSKRLSLSLIVALGILGWLVTVGLLVFEYHRRGMWP